MRGKTEYAAGWIETSIHEFLSTIETPPTSLAYALITCLDSSFDLSSILSKSPAFGSVRKNAKALGKGVWLPTRQLLAANRRQRIFFGFDEVWFFTHSPSSPKPKDILITGPNKITGALVNRVSAWMQNSGCSLGLGDGTGMNFCARLRSVATHLVRSFSESILVGSEDGRASA